MNGIPEKSHKIKNDWSFKGIIIYTVSTRRPNVNPFGMDLHPLIGLTQSGRLEFRNLRNLRIFLSEIGLMYLKKHADCSEKFSKEIYTHENTHDFTFLKFTQASEKKIIHMELQLAFLR